MSALHIFAAIGLMTVIIILVVALVALIDIWRRKGKSDDK